MNFEAIMSFRMRKERGENDTKPIRGKGGNCFVNTNSQQCFTMAEFHM